MTIRQHYANALQLQHVNSFHGMRPRICIAGYCSYYSLLHSLRLDACFANLISLSPGELERDKSRELPTESFIYLGVRVFLSTGKRQGFIFA